MKQVFAMVSAVLLTLGISGQTVEQFLSEKVTFSHLCIENDLKIDGIMEIVYDTCKVDEDAGQLKVLSEKGNPNNTFMINFLVTNNRTFVWNEQVPLNEVKVRYLELVEELGYKWVKEDRSQIIYRNCDTMTVLTFVESLYYGKGIQVSLINYSEHALLKWSCGD